MTLKRISLVLGSGGARGLAHIGIINWLEEHDFIISSVSGCSIGALVGGIYGTGGLDDFEHWVRAINKMDIFTLMDISWDTSGLLKGDRVINTLIELVGDSLIENLPIRYTAVAADIENEKEVWINKGRVFDAIRASISLPLFLTPFNHNGTMLIDGGVLNPVPIAPTFSDDTDMTIAVNLGGPVEGNGLVSMGKKDEEPYEKEENQKFHHKITSYIKKIQESTIKPQIVDRSVYNIANQAFDAMQSTIARQKLAAYPGDHTIEISRNACGMLEFHRASEMIELGYKKAEKALGHLCV